MSSFQGVLPLDMDSHIWMVCSHHAHSALDSEPPVITLKSKREREHKPLVRRWLKNPFFHSSAGQSRQSIKLCFIVMTGKSSLLLAESISLCYALQSSLHNHKDEFLPRSNRCSRHGKALWDAATLLRIWHSRQMVNAVRTCLFKTPDKPENHVNTIQKCKQDRRGYWTIIYVFTESH